MKEVLGIDLGTSAVKVAVYNEEGHLITSISRDYPLIEESNGYAEQNPLDWKKAVFDAIYYLSQQGLIRHLVSIGISGQMHGLVMLDSLGYPLYNSIIWCDSRASEEANDILNVMPDYMEHTLNMPAIGFTLPKLLWMRKHHPDIYSKIDKVLLPKDYINYTLTGKYSTDVSDASGTGYFDVAKRCWSDEVLKAFKIGYSRLPRVYESGQVVGYVKDSVKQMLGLEGTIAVVAGAGDQAAAALGNGITKSGDMSITLGSSGVVFGVTDDIKYDKKGRVHTFCHAVPNTWHVMGVTQACGLSIKWFKDNFASQMKYRELDELATNVQSNGLIYLPYLMGERTPHLDGNIRGAFIGLNNSHSLINMYRSVLEGVAFSIKDCYNIIDEMKIASNSIKVCGGGAKSALLTSIIGDSIGRDLVTLSNNESGTLGAAILAMVGAKVYDNVEDALSHIKQTRHIVKHKNEHTYNALYDIYDDSYDAIKDITHRLINICK